MMFNTDSTLNINKIYYKQGYRIIGDHSHSAVKICQWTKESLRNDRTCYKELWYPPVESHRCMMMTPYLYCNCHCLYCWRIHSSDRHGFKTFMRKVKEYDESSQIINESIKKRKNLLSGWKGNQKVSKDKFKEALKPTMMTMSLTGEPTLYPKISDLILEAKKKGLMTFLVTNGTVPEALSNMDILPFQLYLSLSAPNMKLYKNIVRPEIENAWNKLNRTLERKVRNLFPK